MSKLAAASKKIEGFDNLDTGADDSYIRIIQRSSRILDPGRDEYVEEAAEGMLHISNTTYVMKTLDFIPLRFERAFAAWGAGGFGDFIGLLKPADAKALTVNPDDFGKWKTKEGHRIQEVYMHFAYLPEYSMEAILTSKKSQIKPARGLNRQMKRKTLDGELIAPNYQIWTVQTFMDRNSMGSYFNYQFNFKSFIDEDDVDQYTTLHKLCMMRDLFRVNPLLEGNGSDNKAAAIEQPSSDLPFD